MSEPAEKHILAKIKELQQRKIKKVNAIRLISKRIFLTYNLIHYKENGRIVSKKERHEFIRDEWVGDLYHNQYFTNIPIEIEWLQNKYGPTSYYKPKRPFGKKERNLYRRYGFTYLRKPKKHQKKTD